MVGMHNQPAIGITGVLNRAVLIPVGDTNRLFQRVRNRGIEFFDYINWSESDYK
jgi:hypothetical protein